MPPKQRRNAYGFYRPFESDLAAARNRQGEAIKAYCSVNGLPPPTVIGSDVVESAEKVLAVAKMRPGDHLIVTDLRVLWQSPSEMDRFVERAQAMGIAVHITSLNSLLDSHLTVIRSATWAVAGVESDLEATRRMLVIAQEGNKEIVDAALAMAAKTAINMIFGLRNDLEALKAETLAAIETETAKVDGEPWLLKMQEEEAAALAAREASPKEKMRAWFLNEIDKREREAKRPSEWRRLESAELTHTE
jgi:hypothetical protein